MFEKNLLKTVEGAGRKYEFYEMGSTRKTFVVQFVLKKAHAYYFSSLEKAEQHVAHEIKCREAWAERKAEEKRRQKEAQEKMVNPFKVGSLFYNSWGYEQTNVNFYEVVKVTPRMVYVREIASEMVAGTNGYMSSYVVAKPGHFVSEKVLPKKLRANANGTVSCELSEYQPGKQLYCSWYA